LPGKNKSLARAAEGFRVSMPVADGRILTNFRKGLPVPQGSGAEMQRGKLRRQRTVTSRMTRSSELAATLEVARYEPTPP